MINGLDPFNKSTRWLFAAAVVLTVQSISYAAGNATIVKNGNTWTLENDVLSSVIVFSIGSVDIASFYNKEVNREYLTGSGSKYLFKYTYAGSDLTANDGGWTLGASSISDISVFSKTWGKQLVVNVFQERLLKM